MGRHSWKSCLRIPHLDAQTALEMQCSDLTFDLTMNEGDGFISEPSEQCRV